MRSVSLVLVALLCAVAAHARPELTRAGDGVLLTAPAYRAHFAPETLGMSLELKASDGQWHKVAVRDDASTLAWFADGAEHRIETGRATFRVDETADAVIVSGQTVADSVVGVVAEVVYIGVDQGILMGGRLIVPEGVTPTGVLWCPPRIGLDPVLWDTYAFRGPDGALHEGRIDALGAPGYAGVSAWEQTGDVVPRLSSAQPGLFVRSASLGVGLGVVFVDYDGVWRDTSSFVQRHTSEALYLYSGYIPVVGAHTMDWAWLAPAPSEGDPGPLTEELARMGADLPRQVAAAPPVPEEWRRPVPDFPADLRHAEPVRDIRDAAVFTIDEPTMSDYALGLARKVGSDVLIRGWFKWAQAPSVAALTAIPEQAHAMGALFGGGITCSALYDRENGLSMEACLDMATRGPDGRLVDAWDQPDVRHGSLSSLAYLDYLFRWCREQIDARADYLFMDEIGAALSANEGYDDHSIADFREYLLTVSDRTRGWGPTDPRWRDEMQVDLADRAACPDGTMASFGYRAYLAARGLTERATSGDNPFVDEWGQFRAWRDDRAWKGLTDRIRAYAAGQGRTVYISANGIAKYVDLQVLGVWGQWLTQDGRVDLSESQLRMWRATVERGRDMAGARVPVVLFHDWGFGDLPFPYLGVPPSERELWIRVRGAEIYAAGGFFAFPVLGPFGCDAARDGTLPAIVRQTAFYQRHRDLFLKGDYVGSARPSTDDPNVSVAIWRGADERTVALHVIDRRRDEGVLRDVAVTVPGLPQPERIDLVSPDFDGGRAGRCETADGALRVTCPGVDAYAVALLRYATPPDLSSLTDPARTYVVQLWQRPTRNEFEVLPSGRVRDAAELNGLVQGMLHTDLRNPPTFLVNAESPGVLRVYIQAVATLGARLQLSVDGTPAASVDLPDLDGLNDSGRREYARAVELPYPAGRHRLTLDNVGGDWCATEWMEFDGAIGQW